MAINQQESMLQAFREKVRGYCRQIGLNLSDLAEDLGLSRGTFSRKLNNSDNNVLTTPEVKQIVRSLAQRQAITSRAEAIELLELMNLKASSFIPDEWQTAPLKNLDGSEVIPATKNQTVTTRHNLPASLNSLIGRQREIEAVSFLLAGADVRLLTLTGPGGVGKTRLAVQIAARLLPHFTDGVYFVDLASTHQTEQVVSAIARSLELREQSQSSLLVALKDQLRSRQILLVLDNFEQVIIAAPLLTELLSGNPSLKILVTSRIVLRIYGEYEFVVAGLALPNTQHPATHTELGRYDAIKLFSERARAVKASFELTPENTPFVAEICARLDGLPLAIELASARSKLFTPAAMLGQLLGVSGKRLKFLIGGARNLPERHQALRQTLDWSYKLLEPAEQLLLARLGVFVGGWSLHSATAICYDVNIANNANLTTGALLAQLTSLFDKSMLQAVTTAEGEPRFSMLETVREYALEQLEAGGGAAHTRQCHLHYYLDLALRAEPALKGAQQLEWLETLETEHDNFRAALENSLALSGELETGLSLATALTIFWYTRTYWQEANQILTTLLEQGRKQDLASSLAYAAALSSRSLILSGQGNYSQAQADGEEALRLLEHYSHSDPEVRRIASNTHQTLGQVDYRTGLYEAARPHFEATYRLRNELGDLSGAGNALNNLAILALFRGDYAQAKAFYGQNLEVYRRFGNKLYVAISLLNLGEIFYLEQDYQSATALYQEALPLYLEIGSQEKHSLVLHCMGMVAMAQGNFSQAQALFEQALTLRRKVGAKQDVAETLVRLGDLACWQADFGPANLFYHESLTTATAIGSVLDTIRALEGYVNTACAEQQFELVVELAAITDTHRRRLNLPLPMVEGKLYTQAVEQARHRLTVATFETAWQNGTTLDLTPTAAHLLVVSRRVQ